MKFEIYQQQQASHSAVPSHPDYRWRFRAGNGRIIATGAEGYRNERDCLHGIELIQTNAAIAPVHKLPATKPTIGHHSDSTVMKQFWSRYQHLRGC